MEKEEKQQISDFDAELVFGNAHCTLKERKGKSSNPAGQLSLL